MTLQQFFLGRQPVVGPKYELVAYELLFGTGLENNTTVLCDIVASAAVIQYAFADLGVQAALDDKQWFINVSEALLMSDAIEMLPASHVVLEIPKTISLSDSVVGRCEKLRRAGYLISLDDLTCLAPSHDGLLPFLSHVKVDIRTIQDSEIELLLRQVRPYRFNVVAKNINTLEEYKQCLGLGFDLFQGSFLAKPVILSGRTVDASATALLNLFSLTAADAEIEALETAVKQVPDVTLRLLKLANSAAFRGDRKISGVRDAIRLLGRVQLNRMVQILLFAQQGTESANATNPLLQNAATRGRLMENLAHALGWPKLADAAFMVGMLSMIDVLFGLPMNEILLPLNLETHVQDALLQRLGELGALLQVADAVEQADWQAIEVAKKALPAFDSYLLNRMQVEALRWASRL